jgi:hypothetical protein
MKPLTDTIRVFIEGEDFNSDYTEPKDCALARAILRGGYDLGGVNPRTGRERQGVGVGDCMIQNVEYRFEESLVKQGYEAVESGSVPNGVEIILTKI